MAVNLHPIHSAVMVNVCFGRAVNWCGEQCARDVQFASFAFGLEKHRATAVAAKAALTGVLRGAKPAQGVLRIVDLYLRFIKPHPSDKGCAVRALATRAVTMHHPF